MSLALDRAGIVQFGTSRFLLGHVAAFVGESLAAGRSRDSILVVQTSSRPEGKAKARALAEQRRYPLRVRGLRDGAAVDTQREVESIAGCLIADEQWPVLERHFVETARWVVSNSGDNGYQVGDDTSLAEVPKSFPGKLTKLLHARYRAGRDGLTLLPCELISGNGRVLKETVMALARRDHADPDFEAWLDERCLWVDTLVDRIVSAAIEPVGAVAEPYALWAIQATPGLALPCDHPDVQEVESLLPYELRKLHVLNLAHSYLVDQWRHRGLSPGISLVREAMQEPTLREALCRLLDEEVLPVLEQELPGLDLAAYRDGTLERFINPYLDHRLADIAQHHPQKIQRRLQPVSDMARRHGLATPRLEEAISRAASLVG
ncbi:mannitol dehydrogenase [Halomonas sp. BM-2019]|uniref:mannitol dehydrogenase family protein n=1 Tax=Halomonas sp. BM-2019 TaxID=2811227 RepID=UPI001B3C3C20|nr:MAG: mannitol dehydrogenase [Halomonas sp. BM-2019]